ncbi:MAG: thioredoxin family protein, partial [Bacteroidales bacterium]|nr:thioredoxin family protein [Bacteroidales bacterium]
MKKNIAYLVAVLTVLSITVSVSAQGIKFEHGTFQEALDKAKAEKKLVFMDCYTSWCGPCKWLAREVFPQKEVGDYFNTAFINVKMDMEKGEGPALMKKYPEVKAFPTLLFLDADGKVLHVAVGGMEAKALITQAKKAADPMQRIDVVAKKYEDGDRSPELVAAYVEMLMLKMDEDKAKSVGKEYLSKLDPEGLLTKYNTKILMTIG